MLFTTPVFLFLFFPLALLIYQFTPKLLKNPYLLIVSLVFYSWSEWSFLPVIIVSMFLTWLLGWLMSKLPKYKLYFVGIGIVTSVAILLYSRLTLPHLGLSFFTFHTISYLLDIYTQKAKRGSLINTGVYLLFFPQIAAGPINKYASMSTQLLDHPVGPGSIGDSISRIIVGLGEKLLIANTLGLLADQIFALGILDLSFTTAWLGIIAYTIQIYFDFLGYSNIALGIGALFGFKLTENFNYPYTAISITDFWGKWHISLTGWLREYIYFPLGGNRKGIVRTYFNIAIVFLVSGIWHGSGWNFIIWGIWHGLFMILEKWRGWTKPGRLYTLLIVMIGWVFFRSNDLPHAFSYLTALIPGIRNNLSQVYWQNYLTPYTTLIFVVAIILALGFNIKIPKKFTIINILWLAILLLLSQLALAGNTYSAFIYFKF